MILENISYTEKVRGTRDRKGFLMKHRSLYLALFCLLVAAQAAPNTVLAQAKTAPPISGVIGKVQSFTGSSLDVQTPSGVVHVDVTRPLTTYKQIPSDLSHVTSASYVGVASNEQAAGKEGGKKVIRLPADVSELG